MRLGFCVAFSSPRTQTQKITTHFEFEHTERERERESEKAKLNYTVPTIYCVDALVMLNNKIDAHTRIAGTTCIPLFVEILSSHRGFFSFIHLFDSDFICIVFFTLAVAFIHIKLCALVLVFI